MRNNRIFKLLLVLISFSARSQPYNCPLIQDTMYFTNIDIRGVNSNPISMNGISKAVTLNNIVKTNAMAFISSFYEKYYYVPDLFYGHRRIIEECLGKEKGQFYFKNHPLSTSIMINNITEKSCNKKIVLKSGETVFITTTLLTGNFWIVDKNYKGLVSNSNEVDIKTITQIEKCYVPFEIKYYKKPSK